MDNIEIRVLKTITTEHIIKDLREILGEYVPLYFIVARWCAEFKHGRTSVKDDLCSGRPSTSVTQEIFKTVEKIVLDDRLVIVCCKLKI